MPKTVFKFKQFAVKQEKSAMKIGTDGVLLGAWAEMLNPKNILDIGTGTGLISLMLAQRFPIAQITAIEIDKDSFEEAKFNFEVSPFGKRFIAVNTSLQNFNSIEKFDLIVSNPPFFEFTHKQNSSRNKARQQVELSFSELILHTANLLTENGKFAVIIPFESKDEFVKLAAQKGLYPEKMTDVKGKEKAPFKRSLLLFSRQKASISTQILTIEITRNIYTQDYISLTKDFYLKM